MDEQSEIIREITPLTHGECLLVFDRIKTRFDFPIHFHPEYELNFILNAPNAVRLVGNYQGLIGGAELVLVGPNVKHGWTNGACSSKQIHEVTIQFHRDLFQERFLERNMMQSIREMLTNSVRGILFSEQTINEVAGQIMGLSQKDGLEAFLDLLKILYQLSLSKDLKILCAEVLNTSDSVTNEQLKKLFGYIELRYNEKILFKDVARYLNMTESTLSRLIKKSIGKSFVNFLNDYRIGFASRWLTETNQSVSEVADRCGFYNISNFNRIFKKSKGCTPVEYRKNFSGIKRVS